jgi:hypothetical protein
MLMPQKAKNNSTQDAKKIGLKNFLEKPSSHRIAPVLNHQTKMAKASGTIHADITL